MREIAKMTSNGRITLPKALRKKMGIVPGSRVAFYQRGDEIFVSVLPENTSHPTSDL